MNGKNKPFSPAAVGSEEREAKAAELAHSITEPYSDDCEVKSNSPVPAEEPPFIELGGVVYTSVFNPSDGRKNWGDMVTAFCHAFRDIEDVTLALKFVHSEDGYLSSALLSTLYRLAPFKCRVVGIECFLSDEDYEKLIAVTKFYVNTSHGEGQCLPLMEFMSCGKPAIAPSGTALKDYIDDRVAFLVNTTREPIHWQHDPRRVYRALQDRIDWVSLVQAYEASYRVIKEEPQRYREMSAQCILRLKEHCSRDTALPRLRDALGAVL